MLAALTLVAVTAALRPPAVPIMVQDPFTSFWSPYDHLYDGFPERWTGMIIGLQGLIRVDNVTYTWLGANAAVVATVNQTALEVAATKTTYTFSVANAVEFSVSFRTPSGIEPRPDYDVMTLPLTFMTYTVRSMDGYNHLVSIYFDVTGEATVSQVAEEVTWGRNTTSSSFDYMYIGHNQQLFNSGAGNDNIDWGHFIVAYNTSQMVKSAAGPSAATSRAGFLSNGQLSQDATDKPKPCNDNWPVLALVVDMGTVGTALKEAVVILGYDDMTTVGCAIEYFGTCFPAYWSQVHADIGGAITFAERNYQDIKMRMDFVDSNVMGDMSLVGGTPKYGEMGGLAYRQVTGGVKVTWNPVLSEQYIFMKEISSDGDVSTVDVLFPSSPFFLYYSPEIYGKLLLPVLAYANNDTTLYKTPVLYNLSWAPHHLGHWPVCNLLPMQQEQMPVEETGNLIIGITYIAMQQQNVTWLEPFWGLLDMWGEYLISALPDPGNQLCTDDFEGPSPHNSNLAIKGIVAIRSYASLLNLKGNTSGAMSYEAISNAYVKQWVLNSTDTSGGLHTRLEYNKPMTWSQKYNAIWQFILGFPDFVPPTLMAAEFEYYNTQMNEYGLPLDIRANFTKIDWSMNIAAMAPQAQFLDMTGRIYEWLNACTDRVPWSDWTETLTPTVHGFKARPVLGGIWAKMLMPRVGDKA
ncbi:Glutaminase A [Diplonema papillatum]|nr:Glutaminase A [Diplonema papillatum]